VINIFRAVSPQPTNPAEQQASAPTGLKRFGKKLYVILAVIAIAIIAAAFFIPQGTTATIPLSVDYAVGEKMVYDSTITMTIDSGNLGALLNHNSTEPKTTNIDSQQTIEVMSFEGENYLLNHTTTMTALGRPFSYSMTEKMNKTGYSTYLLNMGGTETEVSPTSVTSDSYLAQLLSRPEVKVGDSINVPYPSLPSSSIQTTGDLTIKFNDVQDLTVAAGTYKVFRIDITSNNLKMTMNTPQTNSNVVLPSTTTMNLDLNFQIYLEYGTMRQIKSTMQESTSYDSSLINMSITMSMDTTLTQHIKP
jgi:hypothetical protein